MASNLLPLDSTGWLVLLFSTRFDGVLHGTLLLGEAMLRAIVVQS